MTKVLQPQRLRILALGLVVAMAMIGVGCTSDEGASQVRDSDTESETTATGDVVAETAAAEWIGVDLPASASDVRFEEVSGGIDDGAIVRFSMPMGDLDTLVADMGFDQELRPGRKGFFYSAGPDWFATEQLADFAGASTTIDGRSLNVTADLSQADSVTVYILATE